ncbi:helix-turn-helix domain-containing protein [Glutamicibacter sp. FR1]|uniref:helix-turn-helix domain-containing protein n=1 Tax=Glutamicibacter sp. FR1 TaxID=3393744 RepID=UPI0039B02EF8
MSEYDPTTTTIMFGKSVEQMRVRRGWSQSELAKQMRNIPGWGKYSQVAVSRTEDGSRMPRLDEAIALASVLNVQLEDLLSLDQNERNIKDSLDAYFNAGALIEEGISKADQVKRYLEQDIKNAGEYLENVEMSESARERLTRIADLAAESLVGDLLYFVNRALVPTGSMFPYVDRVPVERPADVPES